MSEPNKILSEPLEWYGVQYSIDIDLGTCYIVAATCLAPEEGDPFSETDDFYRAQLPGRMRNFPGELSSRSSQRQRATSGNGAECSPKRNQKVLNGTLSGGCANS